jgi:hypothetical protein
LGWRYLGYLLYPCHVLSLCYAYLIFGTNFKRTYQVWNVVVHLTYFTVLALVSPDTSDLFFFLQGVVFWTQHITLLITPLLILWMNRFPFVVRHSSSLFDGTFLSTDSRLYWFILTLCIIALFCFDIQLPLSLLLNININYVYWPPPGHIENSFLSGPFYHLKMALLLIALTWLFGFPLVWTIEWFRDTLSSFFLSISHKTQTFLHKNNK